jgi:hypothetical protein
VKRKSYLAATIFLVLFCAIFYVGLFGCGEKDTPATYPNYTIYGTVTGSIDVKAIAVCMVWQGTQFAERVASVEIIPSTEITVGSSPHYSYHVQLPGSGEYYLAVAQPDNFDQLTNIAVNADGIFPDFILRTITLEENAPARRIDLVSQWASTELNAVRGYFTGITTADFPNPDPESDKDYYQIPITVEVFVDDVIVATGESRAYTLHYFDVHKEEFIYSRLAGLPYTTVRVVPRCSGWVFTPPYRDILVNHITPEVHADFAMTQFGGELIGP